MIHVNISVFTVDQHNDFLLDLTGKVERQGRFAEAGGGFSDVWAGIWRDGLQERRVCFLAHFEVGYTDTRGDIIRSLSRL